MSATSSTALANEISDAFLRQARELLVRQYLPQIEHCLKQLTDDQIWWRANDESNSLGNLLLHLSGNVRQWILCGLGGGPDTRHRDAEFAQREAMSREELLKPLKEILTEVDKLLAAFDHSRLLEKRIIQGAEVTCLEAIFHVTEHFSMHTGQIILLTKMLSGKGMRFYDFKDGLPVTTWSQQSE